MAFSIWDKDGVLDRNGKLRQASDEQARLDWVNNTGAFWALANGLTTAQVQQLQAKELNKNKAKELPSKDLTVLLERAIVTRLKALQAEQAPAKQAPKSLLRSWLHPEE